MAQGPLFSSVYQYVFGGIVGAVALLIFLLCVRARVLEQRRPRAPSHEHVKQPFLYDLYLDLESGHGQREDSCAWREIMPVSLNPTSPSPTVYPPPKNPVSPPPTSALSTVAVMIAMPSPTTPSPRPTPPAEASNDNDNDDLESELYLPYVELGAVDVEVPREISPPNLKGKDKTRSRAT
ncbi:hypothetical protein K438DRAFT_2026068 [Mycena galopus ATCC 62051]|nr:hypothetical protein K438DRAFT_2026068 [Mycena galopus ATCC 62051]